MRLDEKSPDSNRMTKESNQLNEWAQIHSRIRGSKGSASTFGYQANGISLRIRKGLEHPGFRWKLCFKHSERT
jgi:hypothetical protein